MLRSRTCFYGGIIFLHSGTDFMLQCLRAGRICQFVTVQLHLLLYAINKTYSSDEHYAQVANVVHHITINTMIAFLSEVWTGLMAVTYYPCNSAPGTSCCSSGLAMLDIPTLTILHTLFYPTPSLCSWKNSALTPPFSSVFQSSF